MMLNCATQAVNGFCIMASGGDEQRAVRGTVVCLHAARLNHGKQARFTAGGCKSLSARLLGCFPNVARFDYFDASRSDSTLLHFKVRPLLAGNWLLPDTLLHRLSTRFRQVQNYSSPTSLSHCRAWTDACDYLMTTAFSAGAP